MQIGKPENLKPAGSSALFKAKILFTGASQNP